MKMCCQDMGYSIPEEARIQAVSWGAHAKHRPQGMLWHKGAGLRHEWGGGGDSALLRVCEGQGILDMNHEEPGGGGGGEEVVNGVCTPNACTRAHPCARAPFLHMLEGGIPPSCTLHTCKNVAASPPSTCEGPCPTPVSACASVLFIRALM